MSSYKDVLNAAQSLTPAEQFRLVAALHEDLPLTAWPVPSDEWIAEAQRRSDAFDQGTATTADWPEVRARARKEAQLDG